MFMAAEVHGRGAGKHSREGAARAYSAVAGSISRRTAETRIGGKAYAPGLFLDGRFVRGEVDAVHLVAGYLTVEPPDVGPILRQNLDRRLGHLWQLGVA
jgi:hypothetical protein